MRTVLVSLVSDQTIPNIEFIREKAGETDQYLFISTRAMEQRGIKQWILDTVKIPDNKPVRVIEVDPFSFSDIEQKLQSGTEDDDKYLVNLTGGTKVMSLAVYEFFKGMNAEMYYLIGNGKIMKVHPGKTRQSTDINSRITLTDYFTAYGFSIINEGELLTDGSASISQMLDYHLNNFKGEIDAKPLSDIRKKRGGKNMPLTQDIIEYLNRVGYTPMQDNKLNKNEIKFLTGEWLEEYFYHFISESLNLDREYMGLGLNILKKGEPNELDVVMVNNNRIFIFECKTSIYIDNEKKENILANTIYKSDSLRNKFGLLATTTIVTLSDLTHNRLEKHLDRAKASNVNFIGHADFVNNQVTDRIRTICGLK
jgi:hypothetical protein